MHAIDKHLSQDAIVKIAGISRVAYRSIEAGSSSPRVSTLQNLASALDVKLVDLLTPVKALKLLVEAGGLQAQQCKGIILTIKQNNPFYITDTIVENALRRLNIKE